MIFESPSCDGMDNPEERDKRRKENFARLNGLVLIDGSYDEAEKELVLIFGDPSKEGEVCEMIKMGSSLSRTPKGIFADQSLVFLQVEPVKENEKKNFRIKCYR